jgi:RNA polymerase sigma-70 factor (ECF subfamily)
MTPKDPLEATYRLHGPRVLAYLRTRVANRHDCEELLQDVFMVIARDIDALNRADSQIAWLIGIARNLIKDYRRRRRSIQSDVLDQFPSREPGTSENMDSLRIAIAGLPEAHREVLELRLREEFSYAEISGILSVPIGTVRSRIHHAVKLLKEALEPATPNHRIRLESQHE